MQISINRSVEISVPIPLSQIQGMHMEMERGALTAIWVHYKDEIGNHAPTQVPGLCDLINYGHEIVRISRGRKPLSIAI